MSEQTYKGSCHCGAVAYDVDMALEGLITCDCSICRRKGNIMGFVPAEKFHLKQGEGNLTDYQFGAKKIHHLFCKICGISSFSEAKGPDGKAMTAVNVRCLEGVEVESLPTTLFHGKDL